MAAHPARHGTPRVEAGNATPTRWTMTDLFCGAGGSSCGAAAVAGLHVAFAANERQRIDAVDHANRIRLCV
jgi:DNA (cytosine-5)-methyltransferase 1